jgi:hypothetical protein
MPQSGTIDVIRLVALLGAILLFALGAFMMWQGISAEGAIDIRSSVLSGSIKTGSTGLFIAFLLRSHGICSAFSEQTATAGAWLCFLG